MKKYTRSARSQSIRWAAASALAIVIAGCQSVEDANPYSGNLIASPDPINSESGSPQKTYLETITAPVTDEPAPTAADNESNAETSSLHEDDASLASVSHNHKDSTWAAADPLLHGLAIGDNEKTVRGLYGEEIDSYKLEDEFESITVLEYDGFAVGLNKKKTVQYIEVFDKQADTGLSGLRIGDKLDRALDELGKPETQTDYLLTYHADGAFLKLDIDPTLNEIISIKLIALS